MSTLLTGRGNGGAVVGLPSAPQEEQDPFQHSSQNNMATINVESTFADAQGHQQYDEAMPLGSHSLQVPYSSDRGGDSMQMENYQLFQPSTSYMNPQALDYSHYNQQLFTTSQYAPNIDPTVPRSISPSLVSAHDGPYSFFNPTVAPHQVYPNLAPTSYADPSYHEDEYDQQPQQENDLVTIQDHDLVPHSYRRQHDEVASHTSAGYGDDGMSMDGDNDGDKAEPYAKSLFRCLRDAPAHTMVLREIYDWFKANTDKARDPGSTGWQNSIRHNLSMNKVHRALFVISSLLTLCRLLRKSRPQEKTQTRRAVINGGSASKHSEMGVSSPPLDTATRIPKSVVTGITIQPHIDKPQELGAESCLVGHIS